MENFKKIEPEDFGANAFTKIGKEWMLIMAEKDGKANAMTASWGRTWRSLEQKCCLCFYKAVTLYKRICRCW